MMEETSAESSNNDVVTKYVYMKIYLFIVFIELHKVSKIIIDEE